MADRLDGPDGGPFALDNDDFKSPTGRSSNSNSNSKDASSKDKDKESKLSHVPCKFYKAGACTAGNSCPFSHTAVDKGGPKEVCQWFIKGNCKFGHKCALAHLLPGQSIAMDRKNKKAAQLASQQAAAGGSGGSGGQQQQGGGEGKDKTKRRSQVNGRERSGTGTDKPKPTGNLTATAPGQTNSPVQAQGSPSISSEAPNKVDQASAHAQPPVSQDTPTSPLPTTQQTTGGISDTFRPPMAKRFSSGRNGSSDLGYGPIGSPPNTTHIPAGGAGMRSPFTQHANHFSPGTSPRDHSIQPSTSPYKHSEPQFFGAFRASGNTNAPTANSTAAPVSSSGAAPEQSGIAIQQQRGWRPQVPLDRPQGNNDNAISDNSDDFEEFLPSSLNDLLTPEERQRRASRSGGQRIGLVGGGPTGEGIGIGGSGLGTGVGSFGAGHRYSRSVPAARLLETTSLWKDNEPLPGHDSLSVASLSYRSAGLASDGAGFSPSGAGFLPATSNASGAFLHHGAGGLGHFTRGAGVPNVTANTSQLTRQIMSLSYEESDVLNAMPTPTALTSRGGFNSGYGGGTGGAGMGAGRYDYGAQRDRIPLGADMLSPSSKALQSHAPGQSLPQGLAAGLSRLHLVPAGGTGGMSNGINSKLANEGSGLGAKGVAGAGGMRSPFRAGFNVNTSIGAMGTPPDPNKFSLAALSTSPSGRSSWNQQPSQQSLLSRSLLGMAGGPTQHQGASDFLSGYKNPVGGLDTTPVVSAPIPVRAGMGLAAIANMGGSTGGTGGHAGQEVELFALDED